MVSPSSILHHLRNNVENPKNTILIVSWQAPHTLGRKLVERWEKVRIFGEEYQLKAEVEVTGGYSAHADRGELQDYVRELNNGQLKQVFVVHGEEEASLALADGFRDLGVPDVMVPEPMEEIVL